MIASGIVIGGLLLGAVAGFGYWKLSTPKSLATGPAPASSPAAASPTAPAHASPSPSPQGFALPGYAVVLVQSGSHA
jgi:hypothetical protein